LQALRISIHHPGKLADADDPTARHVRHPGLARNRRHVMLAMALEAYATEHDHFVITFNFLEGLLQNQRGILAVTGEKFLEGTRNASGSFDQSGSLRIIARPSNNRPERRFDIGYVGQTDIDAFRGSPQFQCMHIRTH
jgi:hypothetical protein